MFGSYKIGDGILSNLTLEDNTLLVDKELGYISTKLTTSNM